MYNIPNILTASYEWYKPEIEAYKALSSSERDHVDNGGLLIRKIKI